MKSKKGKKGNKKIIIAVISAIIALASIFTFVPMQFGNTTYTGVWGAINVSSQIHGGLYAEYDIKGEASQSDINTSMEIIKKTLGEQGYQSCNVLSVDGKKIRVEIGYPTTATSGFASAYSALTSVSVGAFEFRSASSGDDYKVVSAKDHIEKMSVADYNGTTYLTIEFNKSGEESFKELCSASSTIYVYMGDNLQTSFNASNVADYSQMQLSIADYTSAKDFYYKAMFGSIKVNLNADTQVINTMTSLLGIASHEGYSVVFWLLISFIVVLIVAAFVYMAVKYRVLALLLLPLFVLDMVIAFWIFAGAAIVEINIVGLIALIIGVTLIFTGSLYYIGRIAEEYKLGKTIDASIEAGTKKARPAQIATIILQVVLFAILALFIKSIASACLILFVLTLLSGITNIVLLPWFVNMYNKTNRSQGKPFGLKQAVIENTQEGNINE